MRSNRVLVFRLLSLAYGTMLTVLLLVPNPGALFGLPPSGFQPRWGVHFIFFVGITFLVLGSRFFRRSATALALLVGYAIVIESLQVLVPLRTVELKDYAENLGGIVVGTLLWMAARNLGARFSSKTA